MDMATQAQEEYIYCICLPFQCTSQGPSYLNSVLMGHSPPSPESFVAKVGITKNPAGRLCDIYTAFQEFGEPQPLLSTLSPSDDPQMAIMKAKSIDNIIFIEKVHSPGNAAEKDIRTKIIETTVINLGQPELTEEFRESFKAKVPTEKRVYVENHTIGITEWIIISNPLAKSLQKRFREGGIWQQHHLPSGEELTSTLSTLCLDFSFGKAPSQDRIIWSMAGKQLPLLIEFKALQFSCTLDCMLVMMEKPEQEN